MARTERAGVFASPHRRRRARERESERESAVRSRARVGSLDDDVDARRLDARAEFRARELTL